MQLPNYTGLYEYCTTRFIGLHWLYPSSNPGPILGVVRITLGAPGKGDSNQSG